MPRTVSSMALLVMIGLASCTGSSEPSPPTPVEVSVFLSYEITPEEQRALEAALNALPDASGVTFKSSEQAYEEFRTLFADEPELVEAVEPDALPASYEFMLDDPDRLGQVQAELIAMPGVADVAWPATVPPTFPTPTR